MGIIANANDAKPKTKEKIKTQIHVCEKKHRDTFRNAEILVLSYS